jgi:hypothetical protein
MLTTITAICGALGALAGGFVYFYKIGRINGIKDTIKKLEQLKGKILNAQSPSDFTDIINNILGK